MQSIADNLPRYRNAANPSPLNDYGLIPGQSAPLLSDTTTMQLRGLIEDSAAGFRRKRAIGALRRKFSEELNSLLHQERTAAAKAAEWAAQYPGGQNQQKYETERGRLRCEIEAKRATLSRVDAEESEIEAWHHSVTRIKEVILEGLGARVETLFPDLNPALLADSERYIP